jgi:hypothetical protein
MFHLSGDAWGILSGSVLVPYPEFATNVRRVDFRSREKWVGTNRAFGGMGHQSIMKIKFPLKILLTFICR